MKRWEGWDEMQITTKPDEAAVKRLLAESGLPTADITAGHLEHFFGCSENDDLGAVVGLELFGAVGLLRSLAVAAPVEAAG